MTKLSDRIKILRALNGLSQNGLASLAGISSSRIAIIAYEHSRYRPTRNNLIGVANALSVTPAYLDYGEWGRDICAIWRPSMHKRGGFDKKTAEVISLLLPGLVLEAGFDLFAKIHFADGVAVLFGHKETISCAALVAHEIAHLFPGNEISARPKRHLSCFQKLIRIIAPAHRYTVHPNLSSILECEAITSVEKNSSTDMLVKAASNIAHLKRLQDQGALIDFSDAIDVLYQAFEQSNRSK